MSDLAGLSVSRETFERLKTYESLLHKWNPAINLVAKSTLADAWARHFVDSAQIFQLAPLARHWADLGSGGGFPGMVIAILAAEHAPDMQVTLVESDQRKATFLRTVAREAGVRANVIAERIEDVPPLGADVLSARALASLDVLLGFAQRHLLPDGVAIFPKGANHQAELTEALANWRFEVQKSNSVTDSNAVILAIKGLSHV
ncbi:16S rRNA (guanine(527)-N(7))-methyltransferase RsmG [Actibacterium sp. XHP0104]|uniref:16S rRNA (guanine(527)-N(7))-methyltransferase RsmG n=1 Tax=Actibacterium sp. XHP0104 TaxID=2984335 RepID=UPI0021E97EFC|nr:16S rRNA (guanine(527)-N(7))-methyltransferase RsmG [Actibacterium sp. XHP0104]MCV2882100.1 16S rRNA (guanine(527)-N(7))-methyltransferase RsmG [Actibacterium sp. XHP0104]